MKPSARIAKIYEESTNEISASPTLATMNRLEFMQVHKAIAELVRILDELHEEKKESETPNKITMANGVKVELPDGYQFEENFEICGIKKVPPQCPEPSCGCKVSVCCGKECVKSHLLYGWDKACAGCLKEFTPAPCTVEEKKKIHVHHFPENQLQCSSCFARRPPTDNTVEEWESYWKDLYENGDPKEIGLLTPQDIYRQRTNFIRRTCQEAISTAEKETKRKIRNWIKSKIDMSTESYEAMALNKIKNSPELKD